jgi:hypothetical protein
MIMSNSRKSNRNKTPYPAMAFGFDRETDERSLQLFLERFTDEQVMDILLPRLPAEDILQIVDFLTGLMRKCLSEKEYHTLFLAEEDPPVTDGKT